MTDKASERDELMRDLSSFVPHKQGCSLGNGGDYEEFCSCNRDERKGRLADFIIYREQSLKQEHERAYMALYGKAQEWKTKYSQMQIRHEDALDEIKIPIQMASDLVQNKEMSHQEDADCLFEAIGESLSTISRLRGKI